MRSVAGERPAIFLLFASAAKTAGAEATGLYLLADGEDGKASIRAIADAGATALSPPAGGLPDFVLARRMVSQPLAAAVIARTGLKLCSR